MRRVICFLLVMILSLSLVCPALAATAPSITNRPAVVPGESPRTGDMIMTYVTIMLVSLIALLAMVFVFRKKFVG